MLQAHIESFLRSVNVSSSTGIGDTAGQTRLFSICDPECRRAQGSSVTSQSQAIPLCCVEILRVIRRTTGDITVRVADYNDPAKTMLACIHVNALQQCPGLAQPNVGLLLQQVAILPLGPPPGTLIVCKQNIVRAFILRDGEGPTLGAAPTVPMLEGGGGGGSGVHGAPPAQEWQYSQQQVLQQPKVPVDPLHAGLSCSYPSREQGGVPPPQAAMASMAVDAGNSLQHQEAPSKEPVPSFGSTGNALVGAHPPAAAGAADGFDLDEDDNSLLQNDFFM